MSPWDGAVGGLAHGLVFVRGISVWSTANLVPNPKLLTSHVFSLMCIFLHLHPASHFPTLHFQWLKLFVSMRRCERKPYLPRQCGQKAMHHFMCKWSSLITELSIRFSAKKKFFFSNKKVLKTENKWGEYVFVYNTQAALVQLFSRIPASICLRICIFQCVHAFLAHKLLPYCELHDNCCQSNPPNTQTNMGLLLLRFWGPTRPKKKKKKHPNTPTDQAEQRDLGRQWNKSCNSLSGRLPVKAAEWTHCCLSFALVVNLIGPFRDEVGSCFYRRGPRRTATF